MKLFKPETAAPTPLAIGLVLGTVLLALLLLEPNAHAAALAVLRFPDATRDAHAGAAIGEAAVQYWPLTLALAAGAVWAVRRERSRDQRARQQLPGQGE